MSKIYLITLYLVLNVFHLLFANATGIDIAGGTVSISVDNHQIEMLNEEININLKQDKYFIEVEYNFYNNSNDITLKVGFPQWFYGSTEGAEYNLADLKYYVENKSVEYTIVPIQNDNLNRNGFKINYKQWYYTNVTFPKNKIIKIKNSYNCPYGVSGPYFFADYLYGTGRNWYKKIGTIQINLKIDESIWISYFQFSKSYKYEQIKRDQYKIIMKEVEPDNEDTIEFLLCIGPLWETPMNSLFKYDSKKGSVLADNELDSKDLQFLTVKQLELYKIFYNLVENPRQHIDLKQKEYFDYAIAYLERDIGNAKNYKWRFV